MRPALETDAAFSGAAFGVVIPVEPALDELLSHANRRRGPGLHHVRSHIARRGDKVFWRVPHLRGNARLGVVRSRTVQLSFH